MDSIINTNNNITSNNLYLYCCHDTINLDDSLGKKSILQHVKTYNKNTNNDHKITKKDTKIST